VIAAIALMGADDDIGDFWDRARAMAHARGSLFTALSTSIWEGFWRWRRGELPEALACLRLGLEQSRMWGGAGVAQPYAHAFEIGCLLDRGDVAAARRAADAALAEAHVGEGDRLLQHAIARLLVVEGRYEEALGAVVRVPAPVPVPNPVWNPWRTTGALALRGLGRAGEAVELMEEEIRLLRRWGAPSYLGTALRHLGELTGRLDLLREAVELLTPTSCALELARARLALGRRRELGDDEAVPLLRAASRTAHAQAAEGVLRQTCAALEARGQADDPHSTRPELSLTERRVLDLTAAGLGVREVAEQLFVTPGTVHAVLEAADGGRLKFVSSAPTDAVRT
jgi:DNA-binding CsgD family transcriptional regulator